MTAGDTRTMSFSKSKACSVCGALTLLGASAALAQDEIVIGGKAVPVEEDSYKCDMTAEEIPDDLSIKRLANLFHPGSALSLRDMYVAENGEEVWYRISTLIPKTFPMEADHRLVLSQWHERLRAGGHSLRPNISHRLWNGRFVVTLWSDDVIEQLGTIEGDGQILYSEPRIDQGVYHEYVYRVVWSPENDAGSTPGCGSVRPGGRPVTAIGRT
ncbi:heparin lyase I family protein [Roseibium sp.]|uniref:heparin lyase I family protein n=1 Tax=Roseibium sp. TaxID=1936156 RepID=UPI003D0CA0F0